MVVIFYAKRCKILRARRGYVYENNFFLLLLLSLFSSIDCN